MNELPEELYSDWTVYSQILFHIIQNAFKFSNPETEIKIFVSYCPLKNTPVAADLN